MRNELERYIKHPDLLEWAKNNRHIFTTPSSEEIEIVRQILVIPEFRNLIPAKNLRHGWPAADPFVIAKAQLNSGIVVTAETFAPGRKSPRIPDVCEYLGVKCMHTEEFVNKKCWQSKFSLLAGEIRR